MPKPILLLLGAVAVLIIFVVVAVVLSSIGKDSTKAYIDIMSRSAEIVRISELAKADVKDADTLALLTTASVALSSEQSQFSSYLQTTGQTVDPKLLTAYLNTETDKGLQNAVAGGNVEETYITYLKGSLNGYLNSLKTAQKDAGAKAKPIISVAIASTEALLASPLLTSP